MIADEEGFLYPVVYAENCINCHLCERICPILASEKKTKVDVLSTYACYSRHKETRSQSSSGGVFSLIASLILREGGVVFGACFDKNFCVVHRYVENIDDLSLLRGSKYVQSYLGNTFSNVRAFLKKDRKVLFCGTPCEVEGLLNYLGECDKENLLTIDFICHGVPSVKVWHKYLTDRNKNKSANIKSVNFRDKRFGWKTYSLRIDFTDNSAYSRIQTFDKYLQTFIRNYSLRPSCYACRFKGTHRSSDLTLGDYWGVQHIHPEIDNDLGVSLVLTHSFKGETVMSLIEKDALIYEGNLQQIAIVNHSLIKSAVEPKNRSAYYKDIDHYSFDELYYKYVYGGVFSEMKNIAKGWAKIALHYLR